MLGDEFLNFGNTKGVLSRSFRPGLKSNSEPVNSRKSRTVSVDQWASFGKEGLKSLKRLKDQEPMLFASVTTRNEHTAQRSGGMGISLELRCHQAEALREPRQESREKRM